MLFERHSVLHDGEGRPSVLSHGSPWCYDTYVLVSSPAAAERAAHLSRIRPLIRDLARLLA